MEGTLERAGDTWKLRFTRQLAHPAEKVWRAITEPEHLQAWFPDRIVGEWKPGASLRFEDAMGGGFDGRVIACEPPSLLEFSWGTDSLRFEIAPRGAGCTLTLLDTFDPLGKAARDAAGWHECLDLLELHLEGQQPSFKPGQRWVQVHPKYVEKFGPEASTIGPPEGWDPEAAAKSR